MTAKIAILSVAVYHDKESPIYGDSVFQISLDDEAAGPFIKINAAIPHDEQKPNVLAIDYETEWPKIKEAVEMLMNQDWVK